MVLWDRVMTVGPPLSSLPARERLVFCLMPQPTLRQGAQVAASCRRRRASAAPSDNIATGWHQSAWLLRHFELYGRQLVRPAFVCNFYAT
jgi:hypothetical protein